MTREMVFECRVLKVSVVAVVAASLLGGCMSVPAVSGPVPQSPGARQKTITELLTQWADLTNDAIAATGVTEGWYRGAIQDKKPWDPAAEEVSLPPCSTVGSTEANQVKASVTHDPFADDPHPIADKLTAHWESQGFTVTRTVDWTSPSGRINVVVGADRSDGVYYVLTATNEIVAIDVVTECSADPSIQSWAAEKSLRIGRERREERRKAATSSPSAEPEAPAAHDGVDDDGWAW